MDDWMERGNCRGIRTDLFFPEQGTPTGAAKAMCQDCQVKRECLAYALAGGERFGIWGGVSERERQGMRRARCLAESLPQLQESA